MGIITSRFSRKLSTIETLEKIEKDISKLEQNRRHNQVLQKRIAASLLLYSVLLYIIAAVVFYCVYFPKTWQEALLYSLPLIVFPFLVWGARKLTHWFFVQRLSASELALSELRQRKKTILEEVMEKETYKKAREILEKYDPARFKQLEAVLPMSAEKTVVDSEKPNEVPLQSPQSMTFVRQRVRVQPATPRMPVMRVTTPRPVMTSTSQTPRAPMPVPIFTSSSGSSYVMQAPFSPPPGPPMPRTVLPQKRGAVDKVIDYIVGDGPQNRYALICQQCHSHNGMALPEEFEYLSFRCCYCYHLNPSKKLRPLPPKLVHLQVAPSVKGSEESSKLKHLEGGETTDDGTGDEESSEEPEEVEPADGTPASESQSAQNQPEDAQISVDKHTPSETLDAEEEMEIEGKNESQADSSIMDAQSIHQQK